MRSRLFESLSLLASLSHSLSLPLSPSLSLVCINISICISVSGVYLVKTIPPTHAPKLKPLQTARQLKQTALRLQSSSSKRGCVEIRGKLDGVLGIRKCYKGPWREKEKVKYFFTPKCKKTRDP